MKGVSLMPLACGQHKGYEVTSFWKVQGENQCGRWGSHYAHQHKTWSPTSCSNLWKLWLCKLPPRLKEYRMSCTLCMSLWSYVFCSLSFQSLWFFIYTLKAASSRWISLSFTCLVAADCLFGHKLVISQLRTLHLFTESQNNWGWN